MGSNNVLENVDMTLETENTHYLEKPEMRDSAKQTEICNFLHSLMSHEFDSPHDLKSENARDPKKRSRSHRFE